ncbi:MAG: hypothetical protein D6B27_11985 [Gammaproteobacteria bacterium]|nr:MAG: hypothetical protein D6B27_11985 [Gammaproteobacteria bacterium]
MKKRLVGVAVLVALIVVFVPMLLNGPVDSGVVQVPVKIPLKPISDKEALEARVDRKKVEDSIPEVSDVQVVTEQNKEHIQEKHIIKQAKVSSVTNAIENSEVKTADDKEEIEVIVTKKSTTKAAAINDEKVVGVAWDVQVGSFSSEENALSLKKKLGKKGYRVYVETFEVNNKNMYRVRVGPEMDKAKVERIAKKLKNNEKLPAKIYQH